MIIQPMHANTKVGKTALENSKSMHESANVIKNEGIQHVNIQNKEEMLKGSKIDTSA